MVNTLVYIYNSVHGASVLQWLQEAYCSGRPTWRGDTIPDLAGKVIIVTGGSSGIGKHVVQILPEHNAKVYLAARNATKTSAVIQELAEVTGKHAIFLKLDLADLRSVKAAAEEFMAKETELHYMFNNGGVMVTPLEDTTVQGYDLQFGTNVLGHFYLAKLLMPTLVSTSSVTQNKVRVVTTSSSATLFAHKFRFDWLKDGPARRQCHPGYLYTQSKVGDGLLAIEIAKRYGEFGVIANYCNPGNLKTNLTTHITGLLNIMLALICIFPSKWGAYTLLWAAFGPGSENTNGKYVVPWGKVGRPGPGIVEPGVGEKLWDWLDEQVQNLV